MEDRDDRRRSGAVRQGNGSGLKEVVGIGKSLVPQ